MVRLNRIYTRTGDQGDTGLGDGSRVAKTDVRIRALGTIDEVNCVIGVALTEELPEQVAVCLRHIQNELFDLGADLSCPGDEGDRLRITDEYGRRLEQWIDDVNSGLDDLESFVLPGGSRGAATVHLARAVCRRAELDTLAAAATTTVNSAVLVYLNRLSDLLFVAARRCNAEQHDDVLWVPGGERTSRTDTRPDTADQ